MQKGLAIRARGNRMLLVLGLVLGLLAAVLTVVYLNNVREEKSVSGGGAADTVPAVVAAQEIAAGTRITAEMVNVRLVPAEVAIADRLGKSEDVVGKVAVVDIVSGEEVAASRVVTATEAGQAVGASNLAEVVPLQKPAVNCTTEKCGQRAVSVAVAPVTSSGGQIRPGDRVDVVLAFQDGGAITILQDIEVLSIDQDLVKVVAGNQDETRTQIEDGKETPEATTATLAVWPEEAQILTAGEEFTEAHKMKVLDPAAANALGMPQGSEFDCEGSVRLVLRHVGQQGPMTLETRGTCASTFAYIWGLK